MGLDMYLTVRTDFYEYFMGDEKYAAVQTAVRNTLGTPSEFKATSVAYEVMYWRCANAIHKWFVDNVQEGVDECQESYVSVDQLETLLDVCRRVLEDNSLASQLLPTESGFFFGSTEYDEWYFENVRNTYEGLGRVLDFMRAKESVQTERWGLYYQAS